MEREHEGEFRGVFLDRQDEDHPIFSITPFNMVEPVFT